MRSYEYENIHRYKRLDRITNFITNIVGFLTTSNSKDDLMGKMSEFLLDDRLIIWDKYTVDELNDFTEDGAMGDGAHDDYIMAFLIALYCGREAEARDRREGRIKKPEDTEHNTFHIINRLGTVIDTTTSQSEAERLAKKHIGTSIVRQAGATATAVLAGTKRKVPADFQSTDFSPIHDRQGTAHKMVYDEGVDAEDVTPEAIAEFEANEEALETVSDEGAWRWS
jgi:hypothetical protein